MDNHYLCHACFLEINEKKTMMKGEIIQALGYNFTEFVFSKVFSQADYIFKPLKFEVLQ